MLIISSPKNNKFKLCSTLSSILIIFCSACSVTSLSDTDSLIAELDAELPKVIASGNSPSIQVAVVSQKKIIWSQAFGENTSIEHVYMNASVQKMFTAATVLQLVEKGLVDLDTDIGTYLPFQVRHPNFPETSITIRMLLAHRSGLDAFSHQFEWDTACIFSPQYRPPCPAHLADMSQEEFLIASLRPEGSNYTGQAWVLEPDEGYHYAISAYPLLRYLVSQVTQQSYTDYIHKNIFAPLEMSNSGFSAEEFSEHHAVPYTRINGQNIEIPTWDGQGSMMHTTAEDMAKFILALMNDGKNDDFQLLRPETIQIMQQRTSHFKVLFKSSDDMLPRGHGLGLFVFQSGWYGHGGSAPGFQCLLRFQPSKQVGYVILSNVNAILGGGDNYESARSDIYEVQNALILTLDPTLVIRRRAGEFGIIGALVLWLITIEFWIRRRKSRH